MMLLGCGGSEAKVIGEGDAPGRKPACRMIPLDRMPLVPMSMSMPVPMPSPSSSQPNGRPIRCSTAFCVRRRTLCRRVGAMLLSRRRRRCRWGLFGDGNCNIGRRRRWRSQRDDLAVTHGTPGEVERELLHITHSATTPSAEWKASTGIGSLVSRVYCSPIRADRNVWGGSGLMRGTRLEDGWNRSRIGNWESACVPKTCPRPEQYNG
jgi:hypothetical protein